MSEWVKKWWIINLCQHTNVANLPCSCRVFRSGRLIELLASRKLLLSGAEVTGCSSLFYANVIVRKANMLNHAKGGGGGEVSACKKCNLFLGIRTQTMFLRRMRLDRMDIQTGDALCSSPNCTSKYGINHFSQLGYIIINPTSIL